MERLPEDALLKFHPDTMMAVRRLYRLDKPGQMDEAIDILEAWIMKQQHFVKTNFSREYLERVIIQLKGSIERSKAQLDKICTLRTMLPKFFEVVNPQVDLEDLNGYTTQCLMPKMTEDNHRIFMFRMNADVPHTTKRIFHMYLYSLMIVDYIKSRDYCDGVSVVCDLRGVAIAEFVSQINLTELRQLITIAMEGYDIRLKRVLYISTSNAINLLINLMKQLLSPKMAGRLHVHKTVEEIHKFVPRDLLPEDYGGKEKKLEALSEDCLKVLSSAKCMESWQEMRNFRTDESRRSTCTFDESLLGLSGTFRTLNVD